MQIFIKTMTGKTIPLEVEADEMVLQIKQKISKMENILVGEQKFILASGHDANDQQTIRELNKELNDTIDVRLVVRPKNEKAQDLINHFDRPEVCLLWTINYLDHHDEVTAAQAASLIGSTDFRLAYQAYQKKCKNEADGKKTYLALTAVHSATLDSLFGVDAPKTYQPDTGDHISIYNSREGYFPVLTLAVVFNTERGVQLIQNADDSVKDSAKYQNKLSEYTNRLADIHPSSSPAPKNILADRSPSPLSTHGVIASHLSPGKSLDQPKPKSKPKSRPNTERLSFQALTCNQRDFVVRLAHNKSSTSGTDIKPYELWSQCGKEKRKQILEYVEKSDGTHCFKR